MTTAFYFCWNHSEAVILRERRHRLGPARGRALARYVRAATGKITVETTATGEVVRIPEGARRVVYRFESGEVRRQIFTSSNPELVLAKVKTSEMKVDARGAVTAWRWELELLPRRKETLLPLLFTFEAAQMRTMKIRRDHFEHGPGTPRQSEGGFATLIFIVLLAIMLVLVTAESGALFHLHREVKLLEQQQIKRLNLSQTNATSVVSLTEKPKAK